MSKAGKLLLLLALACVLAGGLMVVQGQQGEARGAHARHVVHGVYRVEDHFKHRVRICVEQGGTRHFHPHPCKAPHKAHRAHKAHHKATRHHRKAHHKRRPRVPHWYRVFRISQA